MDDNKLKCDECEATADTVSAFALGWTLSSEDEDCSPFTQMTTLCPECNE